MLAVNCLIVSASDTSQRRRSDAPPSFPTIDQREVFRNLYLSALQHKTEVQMFVISKCIQCSLSLTVGFAFLLSAVVGHAGYHGGSHRQSQQHHQHTAGRYATPIQLALKYLF